MVNAGKTGYLYVSSPQCWNKVEPLPLLVGDVLVEPSDAILHLGVTFDRHLTFIKHIGSVCRQCFFQLRSIGRIRRYLDEDSTKTLVHALVLSRLDYCNSLFFGLPMKQIQRLQAVQNAAARLIYRKRKFDEVTSLLKKLHWLPVSQRIMYKLLITTYRCIHGLAPSYLSRHIVSYVPTRSLRSQNLGRIVVPPPSRLVHFGDRAFCQVAPKLWNDLDSSLRLAPSLTTFKRLLKSQLFDLAFNH